MSYNPTLITLPAITDPVTESQNKSLVANYNVLKDPSVVGNFERAIDVVLLANQLQGNGGYDYTTAAGHKQLIQDAGRFLNAVSIPDLDTLITAIDYNNSNSSAAITGDVPSLIATAGDYVQLPRETLNRMIALLQYRLGV